MTPAAVHHGHAQQPHAARSIVLDTAYAAHPERFVRKPPVPPELPTGAWLNKRKQEAAGGSAARTSGTKARSSPYIRLKSRSRL
jgi:hypothetical protein